MPYPTTTITRARLNSTEVLNLLDIPDDVLEIIIRALEPAHLIAEDSVANVAVALKNLLSLAAVNKRLHELVWKASSLAPFMAVAKFRHQAISQYNDAFTTMVKRKIFATLLILLGIGLPAISASTYLMIEDIVTRVSVAIPLTVVSIGLACVIFYGSHVIISLSDEAYESYKRREPHTLSGIARVAIKYDEKLRELRDFIVDFQNQQPERRHLFFTETPEVTPGNELNLKAIASSLQRQALAFEWGTPSYYPPSIFFGQAIALNDNYSPAQVLVEAVPENPPSHGTTPSPHNS